MQKDEAIKQFFGAYFHQDWPDKFENWQGVAEHFAKNSGEKLIRHIAAQLHKLSQIAVSEHELYHLLQALGCYYWLDSEAAYRAWLQELATHLQSAANTSSKPIPDSMA